jgi:predicted metal-dependent phosphoesterase TrpH
MTLDSGWICRGAEQPAEDVVRLIHRTGGVAVLAHPWSLKNPFPLIDRLKDAGLDGMEVYKSTGKDPGIQSHPCKNLNVSWCFDDITHP